MSLALLLWHVGIGHLVRIDETGVRAAGDGFRASAEAERPEFAAGGVEAVEGAELDDEGGSAAIEAFQADGLDRGEAFSGGGSSGGFATSAHFSHVRFGHFRHGSVSFRGRLAKTLGGLCRVAPGA